MPLGISLHSIIEVKLPLLCFIELAGGKTSMTTYIVFSRSFHCYIQLAYCFQGDLAEQLGSFSFFFISTAGGICLKNKGWDFQYFVDLFFLTKATFCCIVDCQKNRVFALLIHKCNVQISKIQMEYKCKCDMFKIIYALFKSFSWE